MNIVTDSIPVDDRGQPQGDVRRATQRANQMARAQLQLIRRIVRRAGGAAVVEAALGPDAAELDAAYTALKTAADAFDPANLVPAIE